MRLFFRFTLVLCSIIVITLMVRESTFLIISDQETGRILVIKEVDVGDIVRFNWIHSFEHIPWNEEYEIQDDLSLELKKIEVAGFGAGIPENKGLTTVIDGMIVITEIDEFFKEIIWIHPISALSYIEIVDSLVIYGDSLPYHKRLKLIIEERNLIWTRTMKYLSPKF